MGASSLLSLSNSFFFNLFVTLPILYVYSTKLDSDKESLGKNVYIKVLVDTF